MTRRGLQEVRAVDRDCLRKAYSERPQTIRRALAQPLELRSEDAWLPLGESVWPNGRIQIRRLAEKDGP